MGARLVRSERRMQSDHVRFRGPGMHCSVLCVGSRAHSSRALPRGPWLHAACEWGLIRGVMIARVGWGLGFRMQMPIIARWHPPSCCIQAITAATSVVCSEYVKGPSSIGSPVHYRVPRSGPACVGQMSLVFALVFPLRWRFRQSHSTTTDEAPAIRHSPLAASEEKTWNRAPTLLLSSLASGQ
jgi:hypothetical protein